MHICGIEESLKNEEKLFKSVQWKKSVLTMGFLYRKITVLAVCIPSHMILQGLIQLVQVGITIRALCNSNCLLWHSSFAVALIEAKSTPHPSPGKIYKMEKNFKQKDIFEYHVHE